MAHSEHDDNTEQEKAEIKFVREAAADRKKRMEQSWDMVMKTPEGRAVVWDILSQRMGTFSPTFALGRNPSDTTASAAVQSQGALLIAYLQGAHPVNYLKMLQENAV